MAADHNLREKKVTMAGMVMFLIFIKIKCNKRYITGFSEKTDAPPSPPTPKPFYGGNFNQYLVNLKIRSRSQKCNQLLILPK